MKKSLIVTLIAVGALAVLALELSTARMRHILAASRIAPSHSAKAGAKGQDGGLTDDGTAIVIRLASNPSPMPPFLVNDLDGNIISTAAFRGKVIVVNFWATWCPPCREEIPEMIELSKRYKDRLQVIGVSMDDAPPEEVNAFAKQEGIPYPIVMGNGTLSDEYGGVPALPTSFVVNPDGRVVQKHVGLYPIEVYDNEIRSLLGQSVDAKVETFEDTGQIFLKNAARATELPGVDFKKLTAAQRQAALKQLNSQNCTCGCQLTIAQCRINDSTCSTSQQLAEKIVRQIGSARPASTTIAK